MADYEAKVGDTAESITAVLRSKTGVIDLTNAAEVILNMVGEKGTKVLGIVMDIDVDPETGSVSHQWETAEVETADKYKFEFIIIGKDARKTHVPSGSASFELVLNAETK